MKVVETAIYMAGPYAGMMLADLGADVIKVETEKGDPFRRYGRPETPVQRGLRQLQPFEAAVSCSTSRIPTGTTSCSSCSRRADVFLANWRAGVAESLGLSDDRARRRRTRGSCAASSRGSVPAVPLAAEPAFDTVLQGRSGLTDAITDPVTTRG